MNAELKDLIGKTITEINGCEVNSVGMILKTSCGRQYEFLHHQDCCESVSINEVVGNVSELIGEPLLMAEEVSSDGVPYPEDRDVCQWTFYKFATIKGYVTVRWLGESNGYYGTEVSFEEITQ